VLGGTVVGCAVVPGSTVMVGGTVVVRAVVPGSTVVVGAMVLGGTVGLVFADKSVEWRAIPRSSVAWALSPWLAATLSGRSRPSGAGVDPSTPCPQWP
jgi:hypothetical protein